MKAARPFLWWCGLVALAAVAHAQEPVGLPLLVGDGKHTVAPKEAEAVRALVRTLALPADAARVWMIRGDSWYSEKRKVKAFRISVYLWPQVQTPRLVRDGMLECTAEPKENSSFPESPVIGGWALLEREPSRYAMVAPPDRPFGPTNLFGKSFGVIGEWSDEDVLAVVDAVTRIAPEQQILYVEMTTPGYAKVLGQADPRAPNLDIQFEKGDTGWNHTKSSRWVY